MKRVPLAATGSLVALATILAGTSALAQPASQPAAPPANQPVASATASDAQEIVVTARKRQESVLKVPVIETVIPHQQIEQLQIKDLKDITRIAPSLMIGTSVL